MSRITFDGDVIAALAAVERGDELGCPKCGAIVWVKDGTGRGRELPIHPGIAFSRVVGFSGSLGTKTSSRSVT